MNADKSSLWRLVVGRQVMNLRLKQPGQIRSIDPHDGMLQVITAGESSWEQPGALVPLEEWDGVVAEAVEPVKASDERKTAFDCSALLSLAVGWEEEAEAAWEQVELDKSLEPRERAAKDAECRTFHLCANALRQVVGRSAASDNARFSDSPSGSVESKETP